MHRVGIELITSRWKLARKKKRIFIELFPEAPDERSEASNRCNTLGIAGNELHSSFQLLFSSEIGPFEVENSQNQENRENPMYFPYVSLM